MTSDEIARFVDPVRVTFVAGEQALSAWMVENAYVSWVIHNEPWELEDELIAALDL